VRLALTLADGSEAVLADSYEIGSDGAACLTDLSR
jgi:hypothetical protein